MPVLAIILIPWAALALGAIVTAWRRPGALTASAVQHLAAGVVFAAAAGEVLPNLKHAGAVVPVMIGGVAGIALMLVVKSVGERARGPGALVAVIGIDMLIDGLVLGIAFAAGEKQGLLLTIALTLEVLFLGLAVAIALGGVATSKAKAVGVTILIGALLPVGALLGVPVALLPTGIVTGFFAFGLIALLYLVTEELLKEAHEQAEPAWVTALFFLGFLAMLLLEEVI